jgi:hypothetical protein
MKRAFLLPRMALAVLTTLAVVCAAVTPALTSAKSDAVRGRHARSDVSQVHGGDTVRRVTGAGAALALAAARDNGLGSRPGRIERRLALQPDAVVAR